MGSKFLSASLLLIALAGWQPARADDAPTPGTVDPNTAMCGKRGCTLFQAFKDIISENELNPGDAAKVELTFQDFSVGTPHKWDLNADGPGGDANTNVFPVHAKFTIRRETQYNVDVHAWDNTYSCNSMIGDNDCSDRKSTRLNSSH